MAAMNKVTITTRLRYRHEKTNYGVSVEHHFSQYRQASLFTAALASFRVRQALPEVTTDGRLSPMHQQRRKESTSVASLSPATKGGAVSES